MKYHVKVKGVNQAICPDLEEDFDFAEVNVVKDCLILIRKIEGYKIMQYAIPMDNIAEVTIIPYEDNQSKIPSCRL